MIKFKEQIDQNKLKNFTYDPNPPFGQVSVPLVLSFDLSPGNEEPSEVFITSNLDISISCFSSVLHYGQAIFEGLKAYHLEGDKIGIFRVHDYAERFQRSAKIMGMPQMPKEVFVECITQFVEKCRPIIPKEDGHSLYLRPLMIANDPVIKVKSATNFKFLVMGSIVGEYFKAGSEGAKVLCNKSFIRAFPAGTGEAKTAANYALSIPDLIYAQSQGFEQVLYLDSKTKTNLDELGGMNIFAIKGKKIITPKLTDTILAGVTRKSILDLAQTLGLEVEEKSLSLAEILNPALCDGIFASGTAASIVPIGLLGVQDSVGSKIDNFHFSNLKEIEQLREALILTQRNKNPLSSKWLTIL